MNGLNYADMSINLTKNQADMMNSWNSVFDWVFNVTGNRQKQAQQELYDQQLAGQKDLMSLQNSYNRDMAKFNYELSQLMQQQQQKYVNQNMQKQMIYNQLLSNRGRDIAALRASGINPATESSPVSSSVSPAGMPSAQSSQAAGGAPSVAVPSFSLSSPHPSGSYASIAKIESEVKKNEAETKGQETRNTYADLRELYGIQEMISTIRKNYSDASKMDAETKRLLTLLQGEADQIAANIEEKKANAFARKQEGQAAEDNAASKAKEVELMAERNRIQQFVATTDRMRYKLEADRNPVVIAELDARAKKQLSEKSLTEQDILWYKDKVQSLLDLNDEKRELIKKQAEKEMAAARLYSKNADLVAKEVSWFEEKIIVEQLNETCRTFADLLKNLPTGQVTKILGFH